MKTCYRRHLPVSSECDKYCKSPSYNQTDMHSLITCLDCMDYIIMCVETYNKPYLPKVLDMKNKLLFDRDIKQMIEGDDK